MRKTGERGQTLILFSLLLTVLLGGLSIVIDVGQLYLTRRHLQNVADESALVGAQNRAGDTLCLNGNNAVKDARIYATKNGVYNNSGVANGLWHPDINNGVRPVYPPETGNHVGDCGYLEVHISRTVNSFFAGVFGANPVRIEARAVASGFGGFPRCAIVALMDDPQAIKVGGSSTSYVLGSIYSRGDIFGQTSAGALDVSEMSYAVGTISPDALTADSWTRAVEGAPILSDPRWPTPTVSGTPGSPGTRWLSQHITAEANGWKYIMPGTYQEIYVANNDKVMFHPGIYHITGGASGKNFSIQGIAAGLSSLPFSSPYTETNPPVGLPVSFVLYDGVTFEITATGTAHFRTAIEFQDAYGKMKYANNLIIRSLEDRTAVKIVGQGSTSLWGTIYAPAGDAELAGSAGGSVHGQVVAGRVSLTGGSTPAGYDPDFVPKTRRAALVE